MRTLSACWALCVALSMGCGRLWFDGLPANVDAGTVDAVDATVDASNPNRVVQVATGGFHTCARLAGGSVWCWGDNGAGSLGDGTMMERSTPVSVIGLP